MSETTTTLQALRRAIAAELRMDFIRRYPAGYVALTGVPTTTVLPATPLTQEDNFWQGAWAYVVDSQGCAPIASSSQSSTSVTLELPLASAPAAGAKLEIHNLWNAYDIHNAINRAIESVNRVFIDTVDDETIILQEDTLKYDISALTKKVWIPARITIEPSTSVRRGVVQAGGAAYIDVENSGVLSNVDTNWKVSIYSKTGKGQIRSVVSVSGARITVAAWNTVPDNTSKYALWNPNEQTSDWISTNEWYTDSKEYPDFINFRRNYSSQYGLRLRITYMYAPTSLSAEADTTIVPKEYIIAKACSILHGQASNDTKIDHNVHVAEFTRYDAIAASYLSQNSPHKPDIMLKSVNGFGLDTSDDPLGWTD